MTKGSRGEVRNLRFTTVLSVRHVRSDERVARPRENLRFTTVLIVRHARSDERVVKSTGATPAPQTEKEYILTLFQTILISNLFSAVFSPVFQTAITSAKLSAVFSPVLKTAITSVELGRCSMTIFKDSHHFSHHFSRTLGDV